MSENTKIQWADHTFNPWIGCAKVSPGCAHCYAENETFARTRRAAGVELWGRGAARHRTSAPTWSLPRRWNRAARFICDCALPLPDGGPLICDRCGLYMRRPRVFCASMSEWLDDEVPIEWLADLLKLIHDTPNLDWQLLTKRPENWRARLAAAGDWHFDHGDRNVTGWLQDWRKHGVEPQNVWLGVSVEDQERAWERIPELIAIPAKVRFISAEPLLGPIDFEFRHGCRSCNHPGDIIVAWNEHGRCSRCDGTGHEPSGIHWVIVGGESGPKARPCNVEWVLSIVGQCKAASVPVFVKQIGAKPFFHGPLVKFIRDRKGGDPAEWPEDLRVREFPAP